MLVITFIAVSLAIVIVAFLVWRETSSRPSLISGVIGSMLMLAAARHVWAHTNPEMAVGMPILTGMLFGGRAIGTWLRLHKDPQLRMIALLWSCVSAACLACAAWAYVTVR
jgi:hypothetical protein